MQTEVGDGDSKGSYRLGRQRWKLPQPHPDLCQPGHQKEVRGRVERTRHALENKPRLTSGTLKTNRLIIYKSAPQAVIDEEQRQVEERGPKRPLHAAELKDS